MTIYTAAVDPGYYTGNCFEGGVMGTPTLLFQFKSLLKTAGFVIWGSGDGLAAYGAPGSGTDVITSAGSGAGGMNNNRAWFNVRDPASGLSMSFQYLDTTNHGLRQKFSANGFTTGSPSATTVPGPTVTGDEIVMFGAGTDAAPTIGAQYWNYQLNATRYAAYAIGLGGGDTLRGFFMCAWGSGTNTIGCGLLLDPLVKLATSTDPGGRVFVCAGGAGGAAALTFGDGGGNANPRAAVYRRGQTPGDAVTSGVVPCGYKNTSRSLRGNIGPDFNGAHTLLPIYWSRRPAIGGSFYAGPKGVSRLLRTIPGTSVHLDTFGNNANPSFIQFGDSWATPAPWGIPLTK